MPPRVPSPYKPARPALVEPIQQPLYSQIVVSAAAPQAQLFFFNVSQGAPGQNPVNTNMEVASQLPNPKIFVVRGYRLHVAQNINPCSSVCPALLDDFLALIESYWYRFFIGVKEYLRAPAFYMSSGLGAWMSIGSGAPFVTQIHQLGQPHHDNYYKIPRRPIVIPPQQNFQGEFNKGPALVSLSADRAIWNFLEGDLGREVM
jgi:hypothetical protein